jgi:hypothetical protein
MIIRVLRSCPFPGSPRRLADERLLAGDGNEFAVRLRQHVSPVQVEPVRVAARLLMLGMRARDFAGIRDFFQIRPCLVHNGFHFATKLFEHHYTSIDSHRCGVRSDATLLADLDLAKFDDCLRSVFFQGDVPHRETAACVNKVGRRLPVDLYDNVVVRGDDF